MSWDIINMELCGRDDLTADEQKAIEMAKELRDFCREKDFVPVVLLAGVSFSARHIYEAAYKEGRAREQQRLTKYLENMRV